MPISTPQVYPPDLLLELFFAQSLDGFFFMMLDEPVRWDDSVDKDAVLEYVFAHQRITKVNDAMLAQYGATRNQFIGFTPNDLYRHNIAYGKKVWRKFFDAGRLHVETAERKLDGAPIWIEGDYLCFYDDQGRITGHFGIQRDVTERREATLKQARLQKEIERHAAELEKRVVERTAELASSEARLRTIGNALPDIVFMVDEDGKYLEILTGEKNLLFVEADKLKGNYIRDFFPRDFADLVLTTIRRAISSGQTAILDYPLRVPAGECWFEGRTAPIDINLNGKRCAVFIARDITDRKRAEELETQNNYLREEIRREFNSGEIVGKSREMEKVFEHVSMVAATDATVLLTGETGTGKELIARAIHNRSSRKEKAMIKVNCGAIPAGLVESELFGHEKGAFTGATVQKQGKFEMAHQGTIFLDEIGELPLDTQVKLLRALQEQEFERVGGSKSIRIDARVIAATNRDLQEEIARGAFRSDLYFRLNVFPIHLPPLRARKGDIPLLVQCFIEKFAHRMGKSIHGIQPKALQILTGYHWPGNVRELGNILERAVILCQDAYIKEEHICELSHLRQPEGEELITLEELERRHISRILEKTNGVLSGPNGAATILGLNRSTLWSRMQKLGISVGKSPSLSSRKG